MPIPVIDLFAGPGGLGEGFSALRQGNNNVFKIGVSIEKDLFAHRTLELRAFFRQFSYKKVPKEYFLYLAGSISREELFGNPRFLDVVKAARQEAWHATLGVTPQSEIDIRIAAALNNRRDWLLIGGPPCQAYSLVGRSKMIGEIGRAKFDADPRHFLYREYLRIIADYRPSVFVMENVKGLLSARVGNDSIFDRILADLQNPVAAIHGHRHRDARLGYRLVSVSRTPSKSLGRINPSDFIVQAEKFGIPQARHRLIIVGLREDVKSNPGHLLEEPAISVNEAIGDLPRIRSTLSKESDSPSLWSDAVRSLRDAPWLESSQVDASVRNEILCRLLEVADNLSAGAERMRSSRRPIRLNPEWFNSDQFPLICNHASRGHIRLDLHRYFFSSAYARVHGRSPLLENFPRALLPKHKNVAAALMETKFNDRFRVQLSERYSTTVTSHISKDGHYFIHPDPTQCRSLTVREAARLQTFPDNYFFEGPRTAQYHQVGNAVPPLLAYKIAKIVANLFT